VLFLKLLLLVRTENSLLKTENNLLVLLVNVNKEFKKEKLSSCYYNANIYLLHKKYILNAFMY